MTDEGWFGASDAAATTSLVRFPARWVEPISFLQLIQLIEFLVSSFTCSGIFCEPRFKCFAKDLLLTRNENTREQLKR